MKAKNQEIKLSAFEAIEAFKKLDEIVVSLDKIKSYFAENPDDEAHNKTLSDYIIENKVSHNLADIRGLLSAKFDLTVDEDDMDDLERACQNTTYWSPKKPAIALPVDIENWPNTQIPFLKTCMIHDFENVYKYLKKKKETMYAFAYLLDDDCLVPYSVASTFESLNKFHKDKEWEASEWGYGTDDDVKDGINSFIHRFIDHYDEHIAPLFQKGFDYEPIRNINLQMFTDSMRLAKIDLVNKYGSEIEEMAFYLTIPGEPLIEKNSALSINEAGNKKVKELIDSLYI